MLHMHKQEMEYWYVSVLPFIFVSLRIACSPPGFLRILTKKNRIKALKLKISKNVPIHPEMHKNIFCVSGGGGGLPCDTK